MEPLDFMDPEPPIEVQQAMSGEADTIAKLNPMTSLQVALSGLIAGADPDHVGLIGLYQELLGWSDEIKERVESLIEDLENAYIDRTQLLGAVQFAVDSLPETSQNIRVRAKLEMALTDLVATDD